MLELSLNVLDVAQNSVSAGADVITITVEEERPRDLLTITILDNGRGMTSEQINRVCDPFYTTRTTRKVGLGVPLFKMAAEMSGGSFSIESEPSKYTKVAASFGLSNVDRMPLGDMASTMCSLIGCNPTLRFIYRCRVDEKEFTLDTDELRQTLQDVPLNEPEVLQWIREYINENTEEIHGGA